MNFAVEPKVPENKLIQLYTWTLLDFLEEPNFYYVELTIKCYLICLRINFLTLFINNRK